MNKRVTQGKLLLLLAGSTSVMYLHSAWVTMILFALVVSVSACTQSKVNRINRYKAIGLVSMFVVIFQVLFNWSIPVSERFLTGALAALRIISLSLMVFLFTETTSVSNIVSALSFLPKKICLMLTISFALIPAILRESSLIRMVQQTRGFDGKGIKSLTGLPALIVPLLSRTLLRAEHIAMTMETRGYKA